MRRHLPAREVVAVGVVRSAIGSLSALDHATWSPESFICHADLELRERGRGRSARPPTAAGGDQGHEQGKQEQLGHAGHGCLLSLEGG